MAGTNPSLIIAIRKTINKLKNGAHYQWGHMGSFNCGHLAQEIVQLSREEIHRYAMQRSGNWNDQLIEYCPTSGYPMDVMIGKLLESGITLEELKHPESLSDPKVLHLIEQPKRHQLLKNNREDVILYMNTWVRVLESNWVNTTIINNTLTINKSNNKNIPAELLA